MAKQTFKATVTGADEFTAAMLELNDAAQRRVLAAALSKGGSIVNKEMKRAAPKGERRLLKRSIGQKAWTAKARSEKVNRRGYRSRKFVATGAVGRIIGARSNTRKQAFFYPYEYKRRGGAKRIYASMYGYQIEWGTKTRSAKPFARPAFRRVSGRVMRAVSNQVRVGIVKEATKAANRQKAKAAKP